MPSSCSSDRAGGTESSVPFVCKSWAPPRSAALPGSLHWHCTLCRGNRGRELPWIHTAALHRIPLQSLKLDDGDEAQNSPRRDTLNPCTGKCNRSKTQVLFCADFNPPNCSRNSRLQKFAQGSCSLFSLAPLRKRFCNGLHLGVAYIPRKIQ